MISREIGVLIMESATGPEGGEVNLMNRKFKSGAENFALDPTFLRPERFLGEN